jgi:hypothetical protein
MLIIYIKLNKRIKLELLPAFGVHPVLLMVEVSREATFISIVFAQLWDF